jgi:hypothetical protein
MKRGSQMRTSFTMIKNPPGFLKRYGKATISIKQQVCQKTKLALLLS